MLSVASATLKEARMVALGLLLLLVGVGGGALLVWMSLQTPDTVALGAPGLQLTVMPVTVFAAGAIAMLLLWLGARLMAAGTRRRVAQRRELKELRTGSSVAPANPGPVDTKSALGPTDPGH